MKRCSKCKETKSLDAFSPRKNRPCGVKSYCKACGAAYQHDKYHANLSESRAKSAAWMREQYASNPEKVKAWIAKWKSANREKANEISRQSQLKKPEHYEAVRRQWRAANPDVVKRIMAVAKNKRRARLASALGDGVTPGQWAEMLSVHGSRCAYCDMVTTVSVMEHMVPLSRGGEHDICNVVPACRRCNAKKHTKTALEFFIGRRLDRKVG